MKAIPELMDEALVPGLQVAVITDGSVEVQAFGVRDADRGGAVTAHTVFEAASIGKPVLAYAVLRLASEGRIDLAAPIGRYVEVLPEDVAALTARELLSHTGGLPNARPGAGGLKVDRSGPPRFSYSGEGIRLLQTAVERITGKPFQDHMNEAVFEPLKMTDSSFVWREDYARSKAFGHGFAGNNAGRSRISAASAASSLETTAGDYARFLVAAARGVGLSPQFAREFFEPRISVEEGCVICLGRPRGAASKTIQWGLGFGLARTGAGTFAWHWGDNETMQSYAAVSVDGKRGVVILTNSANGHSIAQHIATSTLGVDAPGYAWLGSYGSYTQPERRLMKRAVAGTLQREHLDGRGAEAMLVAERLVKGRRTAQAAAVIEMLIASGTRGAAQHALLAEAYRRERDFRRAREAADEALRLDPANARAALVREHIAQAARVVPAARLAAYSGRYSSPFGPLEVRLSGGRLLAELLDQPERNAPALGQPVPDGRDGRPDRVRHR